MRKFYKVVISKQAKKALKSLPAHLTLKLQLWINAVGHKGLYEVRKHKGYNDEALKGVRTGQRSIRLNKAYRAIYTVKSDSKIHFVEIHEVNKHEY